MKKINAIISLLTIACCALFASCGRQKSGAAADARLNEVVVYAYDSFAGEWGPGPALAESFEAATGYRLYLVDCGDAASVLSRAILEKSEPQADVLVGIDNNLAERARAENVLAAYKPKDAESVMDAGLRNALGGDWLLTPYDYGHFAVIYDSKSGVPAPRSLSDLTNPVYRRKLILMDPRTSTPGLGFVAWTVAVFGEGYADFWRRLSPSVLTMAPGWSAGYGLFSGGEAPLVISYTTSAAYHVEHENTDRFRALIFDEGHVMQVEGAGVANGAKNVAGARAFIDFLISERAQSVLPLTQWMFPANKNVPLPESYAKGVPPAPKVTLDADAKSVAQAVDNVVAILSGASRN